MASGSARSLADVRVENLAVERQAIPSDDARKLSINYLYAILESEMAIALLARGLDPGIGMFHADIDGRSSLALDAIEAVRPYVEYWLFVYLQASVFANRDFNELPDGEVRLSHPLNAHLAHTAALWRKACEPVAEWLARNFERASGAGERRISAPSVLRQRAGVREEPVPAMCWECGRSLSPHRRAFCRDECEHEYRHAMPKRHPVVGAAVSVARERQREAVPAAWQPVKPLPRSDRKALRRWYAEELQPRLSRLRPAEIAASAAVGRSYAYYIVAGTRIPNARHYPSLAALVGVELPRNFAAVVSMTAIPGQSGRSASVAHASA